MPNLRCHAIPAYELPGLTAILDDLQVSALLDSGSSVSLISRSVFEKLPKNHKLVVRPVSYSCLAANSQKIKIEGVFRYKIRICNFTWKLDF